MVTQPSRVDFADHSALIIAPGALAGLTKPSLACSRDMVARSTVLTMSSTSSPTNSPRSRLAMGRRLATESGGVNIHVGPAIDGRDRKRLERLCRYMARPPVCQERLAVTESGQVVVRFKRAWRNGAHAVVLDPLDFIARLVALIPPPHFNLIRYHGVLAARAKARCEVIPDPAPEQPEPVQLRLAFDSEAMPVVLETTPAPSSRDPWAYLLQRVFAVDVMTCSRCGGRMRLVEIAGSRDDVARVLASVGLGPRPAPRPRPALPGQLDLDLAA